MLTETDKIAISKSLNRGMKPYVISCIALITLCTILSAFWIYVLVYSCSELGLSLDEAYHILKDGMKLDRSYSGPEAALFLTYQSVTEMIIFLIISIAYAILFFPITKRTLRIYKTLKTHNLLG